MIKKTAIKRTTAVLFAVVVLCAALCFPASAHTGYISEYAEYYNTWAYTAEELAGTSENGIEDVSVFIGTERYFSQSTIENASSPDIYFASLSNVAACMQKTWEAAECESYAIGHIDGVYSWVADTDADGKPIGWSNVAALKIGSGAANLDIYDVRNSDYITEIYGEDTYSYAYAFIAIAQPSMYWTYRVNTIEPFVVRWHVPQTDGSNKYYAYYGFPYTANSGTTDYGVIDIGSGHPAQSAGYSEGWDECEAYYLPQIEDLMEQIEAERLEHTKELAQVRTESYDNGYQAGVAEAGGGLAVDTSDPAKTVLSFFAVLFKGVRDFFHPFLNIEFLGINLVTAISALGIVVIVLVAAVLILKVVG